MNKKFNTSQLVLLGLMTAILLLMAYTPLGYLNIGPLAITFNVIPVAVAAITLGPVGGAIVGSVFGLTSFLQCIGVGGTSAMGAVLFGINPVLAFIQRFVPRMIDGLLLGYIFRGMRKVSNTPTACFVTGFCSAFLNTALFMSLLVLLFGNTEYMQTLMGEKMSSRSSAVSLESTQSAKWFLLQLLQGLSDWRSTKLTLYQLLNAQT